MSTPKQRPPSTCVQNFHSCFSTFPQVANMPVSKYEIDAKADTVIVFKTPSPSFSPWSPAEVEGSMTTLDQGLASEDADQTISVKVAIVPDNESESIPNDTKGDEIWYYVFWRRLISTSFTMSVRCESQALRDVNEAGRYLAHGVPEKSCRIGKRLP